MVPSISKPQFRLSSKAELKRPPLLLVAPDVACSLEVEDKRVLHQKGEQRFLIHKADTSAGRSFFEQISVERGYPKLATALLKMAKQVHQRFLCVTPSSSGPLFFQVACSGNVELPARVDDSSLMQINRRYGLG